MHLSATQEFGAGLKAETALEDSAAFAPPRNLKIAAGRAVSLPVFPQVIEGIEDGVKK